MKKILILSMSLSFFAFSQETKQYKGKFQDGSVIPGEVSYNYYDKNDERIKHGLFSYKRENKTDDGTFTSTISGNFKNNLRDGKWSYSITFTDWNNGTGNYITGNTKLISFYNEGLPNNQWVYSENSKSRIKNRTINGFTWSSYTASNSSKAIVTFKNGVLNGDFNLENLLVTDNIKGVFDEKGMINGKLFIKYSPIYDNGVELEYYNNVMIKNTEFNSGGEITNKLKLSPDELKVMKDFADKNISKVELESHRLSVDTVKLILLRDFESNIYNELFLYDYINGDLIFTEEQNFGGDHIYSTKFELIKISEIEGMESAESYMEDKTNITHIREALTRFENLKRQYKNNLSKEDLANLKNKISECNNIIDVAKATNLKKREIKSGWSEINSFSIRGANIDQLQDALKKTKDFREKFKDNLTDRDKELIDYDNLSKMSDAMNDKELVEERIQHLEQAFHHATLTATKNEYNQKEKEIESLYLVKDELKSAAFGQMTYKSRKKHLYSAYEILKKDIDSKIENSNDFNKKNELFKEAITLSDKMIELSNTETKDIEKQLKRETDPKKIKEILAL